MSKLRRLSFWGGQLRDWTEGSGAKGNQAWLAPGVSYLSGCWETLAQGRWRACGRRSRAFADPSRWLTMRLRSDTVTTRPEINSMLPLSGEGGVIFHPLTFWSSQHLILQDISTVCQKRSRSPARSARLAERSVNWDPPRSFETAWQGEGLLSGLAFLSRCWIKCLFI